MLTEPLKWGMRLSLIDLDLQKVRGRWKVVGRHSQVLNANTVDADPKVVAVLQKDHDKVVEYVNCKIGTCTEAMSAATAPWEDTAALDFVNFIQADAVVEGPGRYAAGRAAGARDRGAVQPGGRDPGR